MTIVCNFSCGPGGGKSTSASYVFSRLKQEGVNAELVREYVKDWAWESRKIGDFDQIYLLGKQMRKETILLGKVDVIVTDSPLYLAAFYAEKLAPALIAEATLVSVKNLVRHVQNLGHEHVHYFLNRTKTYNPAGRYQTEAEARQYDVDILDFMRRNLGDQEIRFTNTNNEDLEKVVQDLLVLTRKIPVATEESWVRI